MVNYCGIDWHQKSKRDKDMEKVTVGIVGAGRATQLHCMAYAKVSGISVRLKGIFSKTPEHAKQAKEEYGIECVFSTYEDLLDDAGIDVVDICTPPCTHKDMIIQALAHGKHVICEKPMCGYFGSGLTDKKEMYEAVLKDLDEIEAAVKKSGKIFMYAENFIYAPAIVKAAEILKAKSSRILYAKGEESLAGSSSPVAGYWEKNGGGSLMRIGSHPLGAIVWLKAYVNGAHVTNVLSDIASVTPALSEYEHRHIQSRPVDVEDTATVCLTFSDGTKAVIIACDTRLGGSMNYVDLYCNDAMLECKLTMHDAMSTYLLDEDGMQNVEISEMLRTKLGWNNPFISDEIIRGYVGEMQDFMESIANNKSPKSDFVVAKETTKVMYAAYLSAQMGAKQVVDD